MSDQKKVKTLTIPMAPARKTLDAASLAFEPFAKKLFKNTGNAAITISVEYIEANRSPEMPTMAKQWDELASIYSVKKPLIPEPFHPAQTDMVRHTTDLPCPECKAGPQHPCSAEGETYAIVGNGVGVDNQIRVHKGRIGVMMAYIAGL